MKGHVSQDTLLKLALGILDAGREEKVRKHLDMCRRCGSAFGEIEDSVRVIGDVSPGITTPTPPLAAVWPLRAASKRLSVTDSPAVPVPDRRAGGPFPYSWLRMAAVLVVGFGLGYLVSENVRRPAVEVTRQQIVPRPAESATGEFVVCDWTESPARAY